MSRKEDPFLIEGKRLVKVTDIFLGQIVVPEGIECIAGDAADGVHPSRIVLPTSLKSIESNAFGELNEIREPVHIPAGVESIAVDAFSDPRTVPGLYFTVDEKNPFYYAENGVLRERHPLYTDVYAAREPLPVGDGQAREMAKLWDIVTFGRAPQTENGRASEPIEWIVLTRRDEKALLLSRYALDVGTYHQSSIEGTRWEDCALRSRMNLVFFNTAFTEEERRRILPPEPADGLSALDRIFLLSRRETKELFNNRYTCRPDFTEGTMVPEFRQARRCRGTAYALSREKDEDGSTEPFVRWWCRDYDWRHGMTLASCVDEEGDIALLSAAARAVYIRPALWADLG